MYIAGMSVTPGRSTARAFWEEVYKRFDPEEPAHKHDWRAERRPSPRADMLAGLNRPIGEPRYLLIGTTGTGKSTELLALAEEQVHRHMVVFFDVHRHFVESVRDPAALQHVQPWEVLLLIGIAVYRAASDAFGHDWAATHIDPMNKVIQAFAAPPAADRGGEQPAVNLAGLAKVLAVAAGGAMGGVAGAGLKLLGSMAETMHWNFPLGRRQDRQTDQDQRVIDLQRAVNVLIRTLQQASRPLVIVVDGLDRISKPETTHALFVESALLGSLACRTIVAGPVILSRERMAGQVRGFELKVLANAPVLDHQDPRQPGPGIAFMLDLYRRRVHDLEGATVPEEHLRKLAYHSGGRGRDFVRLLRMLAERAWDRDLAEADAEVIDKCIDERRRTLELGLTRGDIDLLSDVMTDPEHRLPDNDKALKLLEQQLLLPYPNESEWYFPHPLLTLKLVPFPNG